MRSERSPEYVAALERICIECPPTRSWSVADVGDSIIPGLARLREFIVPGVTDYEAGLHTAGQVVGFVASLFLMAGETKVAAAAVERTVLAKTAAKSEQALAQTGRTAAVPTAGAAAPTSAAGRKSVADFMREAQRRVDAVRGQYPGANGVVGMAISLKQALKRLEGLGPKAAEHIEKIISAPGSRSVQHWRTEAEAFLSEMEGLVPHVGKKTGADWSARIDAWRSSLGQ